MKLKYCVKCYPTVTLFSDVRLSEYIKSNDCI